MTQGSEAGSPPAAPPAASEDPGRTAYRAAGVDVDAGARAVELIRSMVEAAPQEGVVEGIGGFAGLYRLDDRRLLAAAADGVGTKLEVARLAGKVDTIGIDLVAMCANDVVCTGARPLLFLDYLAVGRVVPEEVAAIVAGVSEGCRRAGCVLLGGETAEHPGVLDEGRFDLAGFCVGQVDRDRVLDPATTRPGDVLLGLRSSGLHSNGYSLVRSALVRGDPESLGRFEPAVGRTLGEELLEPTAIYVPILLALVEEGVVRSAAHITGGGMYENVPRAIRPGLGAVLDTGAWEPPPIFHLVGEAAGVETERLFGVLNMGIGMVVVISRDHEDHAAETARRAGLDAVVIGHVTDEPGLRLSGTNRP
ncbi:MAG TPA: phosphoribosylformylglycinamidine cyclo-ligase [Actinomycetota bacterium]|nr:phosphoribosylformylglycinamidine cyclo-ligase [Actinomycetota bacterium]